MANRTQELEAKLIMAEMDLEAAKKQSRLAAAMIIILIAAMIIMLLNMQRVSKQYEELAERYHVLCEDLRGGEQ